jgi:hypothetical protein
MINIFHRFWVLEVKILVLIIIMMYYVCLQIPVFYFQVCIRIIIRELSSAVSFYLGEL